MPPRPLGNAPLASLLKEFPLHWLLESPWPAILVGSVASISFWGMWRQRLEKKYLAAMLITVAATVALVVLERLVVTETEQVERTLYQIAQALEKNDVNAVLAYLHPRARSARNALRRVLPRVRILRASLSDVRVEWVPGNRPLRARVRVFGHVLFEYRSAELAEPIPHRYAREVTVILVKHGDRYLVAGYRDNVTNYRLEGEPR